MSALAKKNLGRLTTAGVGQTSVKSLEFYREVARCLPTIMKQYKLGELTTLAEMRRNLSDMIRRNSSVRDPSAIDILIYKGREELEMILMNHKQRHHLISQYVKNPAQERVEKVSGLSPFLEAFYRGK
jgi:NADH dehydrogenase (ubiquinone) 1 alpha subcomplex subunit 6